MVPANRLNPSGTVSIICVGTSSAEFISLKKFLSNLNICENSAYFLIPNEDQGFGDAFDDVLKSFPEIKFEAAEDGAVIKGGIVFYPPKGKMINLNEGKINFFAGKVSANKTIDQILNSLSQSENIEKKAAVILSGNNLNGINELINFKRSGGITFAQEPATCEQMQGPIAAIETGFIDFIYSPEKIGINLSLDVERVSENKCISEFEDTRTGAGIIMRLLSERNSIDFLSYKFEHICRAIYARKDYLNAGSIDIYVKYLLKNPDELDKLTKEIFKTACSFGNIYEFYQPIEKYIASLSDKKNDEPLRIWVPACSTGEEAYLIAIFIAELIPNENLENKVQIFATDINEDSINTARKGIYNKNSVDKLPPELKTKYFYESASKFELANNIKRLVVFSKHNLLSDPPFLKLDFIACRNLLKYFRISYIERALQIFNSILNKDSFLFIGGDESIGKNFNLFELIDPANKIYKCVKGDSQIVKGTTVSFERTKKIGLEVNESASFTPNKQSRILDEEIISAFPFPFILLDRKFNITKTKGDITGFFNRLNGSVNFNIFKKLKKELYIELKTLLSKAQKENKAQSGNYVRVKGLDNRLVKLHLKSLNNHEFSNHILFFETISDEVQGFGEVDTDSDNNIKIKIEYLEKELISAKEKLETITDELEASNQELQVLNESLQFKNEQIKSANEELIAANHILSSTNEELKAAYAQLKTASDEISVQNNIIRQSENNSKALLSNTLQTFVLIDSDYKIIAFNGEADKNTRSLFSKSIGVGESLLEFVPEKFKDAFFRIMKKTFDGECYRIKTPIDLPDGNKKWFVLNFTPVLSGGNNEELIISISALDITREKKHEITLKENEEFINSIFNATFVGIFLTDSDGVITKVNNGFCAITGYEKNELIGKYFTVIVPEENKEKDFTKHLKFFEGIEIGDSEWTIQSKKGKLKDLITQQSRLVSRNGETFRLTTIVDISKRKEAEKRLQESEERYKALINSQNEIVFRRDKNKRLTFVNDAFCRKFGLKSDMLLGSKFTPDIHPEDTAITESMREILERPPFRVYYEHRVRTPQGWRWIAREDYSIKDVFGNTIEIQSVGRDITDHKRSEEAYKVLVDNSLQGLAIYQEFRIVFANKALARMTGYSLEELLSAAKDEVFAIVHPDDRDYVFRNMKYRLEGKMIPNRFEHRIIRKDKELIWVEISAAIVEFRGSKADQITYVDISNRKRAEQALRESELRFRNIYENTAVGIYQIDLENRFIMANPALMRLLLLWRNQKIQNKFEHELFTDLSERGEFKEKLRNTGEIIQREALWIRIDGSQIIVSESARIVKDENGIPLYYEGTIEDITKRKEAEQALIEAKELAERSDRLKTEFLAQVSHEIRTPINTILNFSNLLKAEVENKVDDDIKTGFVVINSATRRLIRTIDLILNVSEIQTDSYQFQFREIDVYASVLLKIYTEFKMAAEERGLKLKIRRETEDTDIIADEYSTTQIFVNLVDNAIKYTQRGEVNILIFRDNVNRLVVDIADTGIGILPHYIPKLFEPFSQEEQGYTRRFEGTGLGLTLVKKYCEINRAKIEVESEKGAGNNFPGYFSAAGIDLTGINIT